MNGCGGDDDDNDGNDDGNDNKNHNDDDDYHHHRHLYFMSVITHSKQLVDLQILGQIIYTILPDQSKNSKISCKPFRNLLKH